MNCRDCAHWMARETLSLHPAIAKQGFARCAKDSHIGRFTVAGYYCGKHEDAKPEAVAARKRVGMY